ncbi:unnamed protein product [Polarella glacialis]|uniref:Alpha-galactosidase n=1 Tax=Polarella glacialis TaxID=89957 RepID=A0A813KSK3_POLGL|nr:unnamed protein product [Polarella glacialis]
MVPWALPPYGPVPPRGPVPRTLLPPQGPAATNLPPRRPEGDGDDFASGDSGDGSRHDGGGGDDGGVEEGDGDDFASGDFDSGDFGSGDEGGGDDSDDAGRRRRPRWRRDFAGADDAGGGGDDSGSGCPKRPDVPTAINVLSGGSGSGSGCPKRRRLDDTRVSAEVRHYWTMRAQEALADEDSRSSSQSSKPEPLRVDRSTWSQNCPDSLPTTETAPSASPTGNPPGAVDDFDHHSDEDYESSSFFGNASDSLGFAVWDDVPATPELAVSHAPGAVDDNSDVDYEASSFFGNTSDSLGFAVWDDVPANPDLAVSQGTAASAYPAHPPADSDLSAVELPQKAMKAKAEAMSSKGEPMKTVMAKASASVMAKAKKARKNKKAKASASVKAKAKKATKTKKAKASAAVKKAMQKAIKKAKAKEGRCEICRLVHPLHDLNAMHLDAQTFASWGVDFVKEDNCFADTGPNDRDHIFQQFGLFRDALNRTGRPIFFAVCGGGDEVPFSNLSYYATDPRGGAALANSWRVTSDVIEARTYRFAYRVGSELATWAGAGAYNDPDMLLGPS